MADSSSHGSLRGAENPLRSSSFQGRFGRMFRHLAPATFNPDALIKLASAMVSRAEPLKEREADPDESRTPAGYTYLGQFVGHDITFDPASSLQRDNDPDALVDFRTPRLDLDSVYGRGPSDQPYLYEDGVHLLLGELLGDGKNYDVPRIAPTQRAVIGDPRNDENVIISQLHALFLRFHNQMAAQHVIGDAKAGFAAVQRSVRWHYQWVVLYDLLPRIVNPETYGDVLPHVRKKTDIVRDPPQIRFYSARNEAFLPVEFSAAAYRFGHSTVRRTYRVNNGAFTGGPFFILYENPNVDLRGFFRFNRGWAVDWSLFFEGGADSGPRVQRAHKISTALAKPLANLPFETTRDMVSLAQRNLIRGLHLNLPSGQSVARAMGIDPIPDDKLTVGTSAGPNDRLRITDISGEFRENAPLWFYILAEAENLCEGERLGLVGGRIVMETFVSLLLEDSHSFLRQNPLWRPPARDGITFGMAELIRMAT